MEDKSKRNQIDLTPDQIQELRDLTNDLKGDLHKGYDFIHRLIKDNDNVDDKTKYFFPGASQVNRNSAVSITNQFIRAYTRAGLLMDGQDASPKKIQEISDSIGKNVLKDIVDRRGIPPFKEFLGSDIETAIAAGKQTVGGWAAAFFYWDVPMQNKKTVGDNILSKPVELEKFITLSAKTTADVMRSRMKLNDLFDVVQALDDVRQAWRANSSAALPAHVKKAIVARIIESLDSGTFTSSPESVSYKDDPHKYKFSVSPSNRDLSANPKNYAGAWYYTDPNTSKRVYVVDKEKIDYLNAVRNFRLDRIENRSWERVDNELSFGSTPASVSQIANGNGAPSQVRLNRQAPPPGSRSTSPLQYSDDEVGAARVVPGSNVPWPIREPGAGAPSPNAAAGIAGDDLDGSPPARLSASDPARNAPEDSTGRTASITIIVGAGFPGHTTIQIDRGEKATYLGLGPKTAGEVKDVASYDVVTLDKDVSPVSALRNQKSGEYHYVDATHYDVKSFTLPISDAQADKAIGAALKYQVKNPNYKGYPVLVGTDYALNVLEATVPGSDLSALSRIPSMLQKELVSLAARGDGLIPSRGDRNPLARTGLTRLQQDEKPPQFNLMQRFNDKVPFNFASGEVGIAGQPRESKAQVSLARAGDGSAKLSVGDSTFVEFEPGQLASVANSDGKLRLSFSKDEGRGKVFGNVMAVDTGTGDVSVLDKHGRLSNLEAGSRINITSDGWDHGSESRPNYPERTGSERTAAGFG